MSRTARSRGMLLVALAALALATPPHAPAAPAAPTDCSADTGGGSPATEVRYRFDGLAEGVLTVKVPVENVRGLVPPSYRLTGESTGTATLVAAFGSVDALTVGCSEPRRSMVSEYGVFVESPSSNPPEDAPRRHAYYLWQLSDDRTLVASMQELGAPSHYAESRFIAAPGTDAAVRLVASTSWRPSPNRFKAQATEPGTVRGADAPGVRFWYDGPRGTVRVAYECPACLPRTPATGSVAAVPGTRLDAVLGGTERSGAGFFIRTDLVATAQLLPAP